MTSSWWILISSNELSVFDMDLTKCTLYPGKQRLSDRHWLDIDPTRKYRIDVKSISTQWSLLSGIQVTTHHNGAIWPSWRLKPPATWLFVFSSLSRLTSKKISNLCISRLLSLCEGNRLGTAGSPHKGPVMRKSFPPAKNSNSKWPKWHWRSGITRLRFELESSNLHQTWSWDTLSWY